MNFFQSEKYFFPKDQLYLEHILPHIVRSGAITFEHKDKLANTKPPAWEADWRRLKQQPLQTLECMWSDN